MNYDDLRREMFFPNEPDGTSGWKFNWDDENKMKGRAVEIVREALNRGSSVVIDNTNLTPRSRQQWIDLGKSLSAEVVLHEIDTPVRECVQRDLHRTGRERVGRAVIERMALFNGFIDWKDESIYPKQAFVICDVDGTIADGGHREHFLEKDWCESCKKSVGRLILANGKKGGCVNCGPGSNVRGGKDWASYFAHCHLDKPIEPIIHLLGILSQYYHILIVSGRPLDQCGKATEDWLEQHYPRVGEFDNYHHLFMRAGGDGRPDYEIKKEIADLLPLDRVKYVLDDRDQVVKVWRKLGLTCLQVRDGNF